MKFNYWIRRRSFGVSRPAEVRRLGTPTSGPSVTSRRWHTVSPGDLWPQVEVEGDGAEFFHPGETGWMFQLCRLSWSFFLFSLLSLEPSCFLGRFVVDDYGAFSENNLCVCVSANETWLFSLKSCFRKMVEVGGKGKYLFVALCGRLKIRCVCDQRRVM